VRALRIRRFLAACLAVGTAACADGGVPPLGGSSPVRDTHLSRTHEALQRVAVLPFAVARDAGPTELGDALASELAQALAAGGVAVIGPGEVARGAEAGGEVVPRLDPRAAAELAQREFGASSVALGRVLRWREREGSAVGSVHPASVSFEIALYAAPLPRRLWSGSFDETQRSLTENLLRARQYPGAGTRWLTAEELGRWGVQELVRTLLDQR